VSGCATSDLVLTTAEHGQYRILLSRVSPSGLIDTIPFLAPQCVIFFYPSSVWLALWLPTEPIQVGSFLTLISDMIWMVLCFA
jgi:hypothetical protein